MPAVKTDPARRHVSREAIYQAARAEAFGCLTKSEDDVESCPREPSSPSSLIYGLKTAPAKKKKKPPKNQDGPRPSCRYADDFLAFLHYRALDTRVWHSSSLVRQGRGGINTPRDTILSVQDHLGCYRSH